MSGFSTSTGAPLETPNLVAFSWQITTFPDVFSLTSTKTFNSDILHHLFYSDIKICPIISSKSNST
ncbi:MAG: hypothetical protein ACFFBH_16245 [Promethearchaeota archaeon]